jgi:hypothetical protein
MNTYAEISFAQTASDLGFTVAGFASDLYEDAEVFFYSATAERNICGKVLYAQQFQIGAQNVMKFTVQLTGLELQVSFIRPHDTYVYFKI